MAVEETRLTILIAEDDPNLGEALSGFLRDRGHRVALARDGGEALAHLKRQPFSLVITDLIMPEADGLTVLRAARRLEPPPLVVIMTGYASIDSAIQATREGAYDYLRKPFKLQELEIAVANASRLLALYRENQALIKKLENLSARLASVTQARDASPAGRAGASAPFQAPAQELAVASEACVQADLERLRNLYQERLLSDHDYQALKQRLLV